MEIFIRCCRDVPEFLESAAVVYDAEAIFAVREQARRKILGPGVETPDAASMSLATEMRLARAAAIVLAVSESEAQSFRDAGCRDVRVLGHCLVPAPAGVGFEGRRDFLFVGRLEEEDSPNVDAVRWFVHEVMPRLDRLIGTAYALNVVGGCTPGLRGSLESPRVRFHGRVQDLECLYAGARICIAPTRFAAGIPHKVHEAASRGVPVVATSLIAGQLNWTHANELLSADEPEQFASACASAYQDRALWDRLQSRALEAVAKDCDPDRFKDTVRNMLSDTRRGASPAAPVDDDSDTKARRRQTAQTWSVTPVEREQAEGIFWMAHPLVASRLNEKASGHTAHNGYDRLMLTLKSAGWSFPTGQAATLGCGLRRTRARAGPHGLRAEHRRLRPRRSRCCSGSTTGCRIGTRWVHSLPDRRSGKGGVASRELRPGVREPFGAPHRCPRPALCLCSTRASSRRRLLSRGLCGPRSLPVDGRATQGDQRIWGLAAGPTGAFPPA